MPYYAYVSLEGDDQILIFAMDAGTGNLTQKEAVPVSGGPGDLAVDPERKSLFVGRGREWDIASFSINQAGGGITQVGSAPVQGEYLALATDRKGKHLLSASYDRGTAEVHRIENGAAVHPAVESNSYRACSPLHTDRPVQPVRLYSPYSRPGPQPDLPIYL